MSTNAIEKCEEISRLVKSGMRVMDAAKQVGLGYSTYYAWKRTGMTTKRRKPVAMAAKPRAYKRKPVLTVTDIPTPTPKHGFIVFGSAETLADFARRYA